MIRFMVTVRFYTTLREVAGEKEISIEADTIARLIDSLNKRYGKDFKRRLAASKIYRNGQNVAFVKGKKTRLADGDEIDLLPPTAGG